MKFLSKLKYLPFIILALAGQVLLAQEHDHNHASGNFSHDHHSHPKNEIGLANNLVYLGGEGELAYGLHLHYIRTIGESRFGYGLGYEQIFDDHLHRGLGIIGSMMLIPHLILNVSPGIAFIGRDNPETAFALHLEANYEFEIGRFHLGPAVEYAYSGHGYHLSMGLHMAYGF